MVTRLKREQPIGVRRKFPVSNRTGPDHEPGGKFQRKRAVGLRVEQPLASQADRLLMRTATSRGHAVIGFDGSAGNDR
jgi:hypothetical protein